MKIILKRINILEAVRENAILGTIFFTTLNTFTASIVSFLGLHTHGFTVLLAALIYGSLIAIGALSIYKVKTAGIVFLLLIANLYLFSYSFWSDNQPYLMSLEEITGIWGIGIPSYLCIITLSNIEKFYDTMNKYAILVIIIQTFLTIVAHLNLPWGDRSNYMEISYQLLLPIVFLMLKHKRTRFENLLVIVGLIIIVFDGARGPLIGIVCLVIYKIILKMRNRNFFIGILSGVAVLIIGSLKLNSIIDIVVQIALRYGFQGSFLRRIGTGNIFSSKSRIVLYKETIRVIERNPLFGGGMMSDRAANNGVYVHDLFLEIWSHYGLLVGSVFIVTLLFLVIIMFRSKENQLKYLFISIFFSTGFVRLLLSSRYLIVPGVYVMLGLAVRYVMEIDYIESHTRVREFNNKKENI